MTGALAPRFLGLDLAWRAGNPSGAVALEGTRFPLELAEPPLILPDHDAALAWIHRHATIRPAVVGIDAPLLGLRARGGRRVCDDEISRAFGRFHAATHSPPRAPDLRRWAAALLARYGRAAFAAGALAALARPALREVFPHAFQVGLFALDGVPGARIVPYKRRRFRSNGGWARDGLGPFVACCAGAIAGRYVADGPAWRALVAERPDPAASGRALKALEDRWDALLCAVAVAVERLEPGAMRLYPERARTGAAILAPVLAGPPPRAASRRFHIRASSGVVGAKEGPPMADKHEALREDEAAFRDLQAAVTGLDEGRMKDAWLGVWGVREILVHISGWHREMVPALERLARGETPFPPGVSYDDYDAWNARFVAAKAGVPVADVLGELEAAHRAFVAAASRLSDGQLAKGGAAHDLFRGVGPGHYPEHTRQILAWRNGEARVF